MSSQVSSSLTSITKWDGSLAARTSLHGPNTSPRSLLAPKFTPSSRMSKCQTRPYQSAANRGLLSPETTLSKTKGKSGIKDGSCRCFLTHWSRLWRCVSPSRLEISSSMMRHFSGRTFMSVTIAQKASLLPSYGSDYSPCHCNLAPMSNILPQDARCLYSSHSVWQVFRRRATYSGSCLVADLLRACPLICPLEPLFNFVLFNLSSIVDRNLSCSQTVYHEL